MRIGVVMGVPGTSTWLTAPVGSRLPTPRVYAGVDVGFRVERMRGTTPIVVPVVKVNGDWVEAELGGGGIRQLTK